MSDVRSTRSPRCSDCDGWGFLPVEGEGGFICGYSECACGSDPQQRNFEETVATLRELALENIAREQLIRAEVAYLREREVRGLEVLHRWPF